VAEKSALSPYELRKQNCLTVSSFWLSEVKDVPAVSEKNGVLWLKRVLTGYDVCVAY
jgi:hypothetical protein